MPEEVWPTRGSRAAEESAKWILARTVPLYALARGGNPVLEGTGVLMKVADTGFLLSAAHVFAEVIKDGRTVQVGLAAGLPLLDLGGIDVELSHDRQDVDLAFARLPDEFTAAIAKHKEFVRLDQVDMDPVPPLPGWYSLVGYPREQSSLDHIKRILESEPMCLNTFLYEKDLQHDAFTIGTSIALSFSAGELSDDNGDPVSAPGLKGVSGCGMWRVAGSRDAVANDTWSVDMIRLAGIEHCTVGRKMIKGALAFHVVIGIKRRYADLRPAIELVRKSLNEPRPIAFGTRQV